MENITKAIIEVMTEINSVAKNMTVGAGNNSYKGVADRDVKEKIRESMIKNGLCIIPISGKPKIQIDRWEELDNYTKAMKTKQSVFTEIETTYKLLHTSGESIDLYGYGQGVDTQDKGAGKATTYALKNTLLNMFLIPTGEDTDNTHSDKYEVPKKTDNKPEITPEAIETIKDLVFNKGQSFTMETIRKKYKVSKQNAEILKNMGIV